MPSSLVPRISRLPNSHHSKAAAATKKAAGARRLDIAPDTQHRLSDRAKEEPVDQTRARDEVAVPGVDLSRGRHALIQQQAIGQRREHSNRVQINELFPAQMP